MNNDQSELRRLSLRIENLERERDDILKKLEDAQGEIKHWKDTRRDPWDKLEVAEAKITRLREALAWYADESHYLRGGVMATRARDALKGGEE